MGLAITSPAQPLVHGKVNGGRIEQLLYKILSLRTGKIKFLNQPTEMGIFYRLATSQSLIKYIPNDSNELSCGITIAI